MSLALLTNSSWVATTTTGATGGVQMSGLMGSTQATAFATSVTSFGVGVFASQVGSCQLLVLAKVCGLVGHVAVAR